MPCISEDGFPINLAFMGMSSILQFYISPTILMSGDRTGGCEAYDIITQYRPPEANRTRLDNLPQSCI
ncbi:MAG: hypothetical protein GDA56_08260 [Hormoscilla sp. GM7CHS1pb]|nr:hypothetical protein [Hormoscilla sp. GM7CHS1pb]